MRSLYSVSNPLSGFCLRCHHNRIPDHSTTYHLTSNHACHTPNSNFGRHKNLIFWHNIPNFETPKIILWSFFLYVLQKYGILFRPFKILIPKIWYLGSEIFGVLLILCWAGCNDRGVILTPKIWYLGSEIFWVLIILCWAGCTDRGLLCQALAAKATASNRSFLQECGDTTILLQMCIHTE